MSDDKKYELVAEDTIEVFGVKLFRIRSTRTFGGVEKGDLGGYVESEENLSQEGEAWVSGEAWVFGEAQVFGEARVSGKAWVFGKARVSGEARVSGKAQVFGKARVSGEARVSGKAQVSGWEWTEPFPGVQVPVPMLATDEEIATEDAEPSPDLKGGESEFHISHHGGHTTRPYLPVSEQPTYSLEEIGVRLASPRCIEAATKAAIEFDRRAQEGQHIGVEIGDYLIPRIYDAAFQSTQKGADDGPA